MSEVVRFYQCKSLLGSRRAVSADDLMAKVEIARATHTRDIAKRRDQLHVPIRFDRDRGGQAARRFLEALAGALAPLDPTGS